MLMCQEAEHTCFLQNYNPLRNSLTNSEKSSLGIYGKLIKKPYKNIPPHMDYRSVMYM